MSIFLLKIPYLFPFKIYNKKIDILEIINEGCVSRVRMVMLLVKILSGDIFPIEHDLIYGLYSLKKKLMNINSDWMPSYQHLFDPKTGDEITMNNYKSITDGDILYLYVHDKIIHEDIVYLYKFTEGYESYRIYFMTNKNELQSFQLTKNEDMYSYNYQFKNYIGKVDWYDSLEELLKVGILRISDVSINNILYLWKNKDNR
jgi:hypothetical protein